MRYVRFQVGTHVAYGVLGGDVVREITAPPYGAYKVTDRTHKLSEVKLLAPIVPGKIVAIGLNYKSHLGNREAPKVPEGFYKTPTSVIGTEEPVRIPQAALQEKVHMQPEGEMVFIMGKRAKNVKKAEALSYVLGYTCGNDVSARDWQRNDLQWWRAKSSDTFSPMGPVIVTDLDPSKMQLICRINGKVVQEQSTGDLVHDVPAIIEFISSAITLEPGDAIYTGTPGAPGDIHPGDVVEVEISGIGVLRNPIEAE
ncbi:MAG: fumarylacetoacetate hydrolase family protein [Dehalococcoidia bacterium]|nr:fumarylacetoacetate hydrolase family protein [Dehalococcoidia bacterium]